MQVNINLVEKKYLNKFYKTFKDNFNYIIILIYCYHMFVTAAMKWKC